MPRSRLALQNMRGFAGLSLCAGLYACAALPDVPHAAADLTGVDSAIIFRTHADPETTITDHDLSEEKAVRLALLHDPRIQSALAKVRMAEADANQARLLPNPVLSITWRIPTVPDSNRSFEATLTGDLVSLLQKPALISAADKRLRESAADALTAALDVMTDVQTTYAGVQSMDAQLANAQRRMDLQTQLEGITKKRFDAGDASRVDLAALQSQTMQTQLDLADLRQGDTEQRLHLARLIGDPRSLHFDWQLAPWSPPPAVAGDESAWLAAAMANRPEIQSRLWELKALGDDLNAAAIAPFLGGEIGVNAEHDPNWRVGPAITTPLPIFDFGQAAHDKVEAQRIAARHDLALEREQLIEEVRAAYATSLLTNQTLADAQDKLLPLLKNQRDQAQRSYETGDTELAVFLQAQSDYESAMTRLLQLQEKAAVAHIKLERAAGGAGVAARINAATATTPPATETSATGPSR